MPIIGSTLTLIGDVLIGIAVLRVHTKLTKEHKIDKKIFKQIHQEKIITYIGIFLLILGYILNIFSKV
jgi:uncharacterized membrane protein YidH (DUF202 family)